jgi:hypothetical protein
MEDLEPNSRPRDLRGAWRWGVWIGSVVLLIGVLAIAGGLYLSYPGSADAPTPRMLRESARSGAWLFVQGAYAAVIGGAILALSLVNLYCLRRPREDKGSWGSPAQ